MNTSAEPAGATAFAPENLAGRKNLAQLIELRWLAVGGQFLTILLVQHLLGVPLPAERMLTLLAVLAGFNIACSWRMRLAPPVTELELFCGLLVDVTVLTGQLYFSGGTSNPFIFLYLLQVAAGSMLLPAHFTWAVVVAAGLGFVALTLWHLPLQLPGLAAWPLPPDYAGGLLVCFLLNAALVVIFIGRINANLRERDSRLSSLRQRAAEEEHIVRMGLLASGAAHELGTPLSTLSVILGDWARMAPFAGEPELREEIEEMQRQIDRCKAIVGGILMSAGETRGEAPAQTQLHAFLDGIAARWQERHGGIPLAYDRGGVQDMAIISDTALGQMVSNILDNALEAAPARQVHLTARCDAQTLTLRIRDHGPGFEASILERLGAPYQSTKGKPGRGLGLFLAVNVTRTLGGQLRADNLPDGGAQVVIDLPLASLMPQGKPSR